MVEFLQLNLYGLVQFGYSKELLISQGGYDPCGYTIDAAFCIWLILGFPDPGRNNGRAIMFCQLVVYGVDSLIFPAIVVDNSGLAV